MARKAREKALYSTYWIQQTCTETAFFDSQAERMYFLDCIKRSQDQYGFYLMGYRLENNGYQLILYDNGNDITKIMRTLNIEYALRVQRPGFKLKSRFKSEIIRDNKRLLELVRCISQDSDCNPYNSFSRECVCEGNLTEDAITLAIFSHNRETYTAFIRNQMSLLDEAVPSGLIEPQCEKECIKSFEAGKKHLEHLLQARGHTLSSLQEDKALRNQLIHYYRKNSLLSLKELGMLFGDMSESAISKIIKRQLNPNSLGG